LFGGGETSCGCGTVYKLQIGLGFSILWDGSKNQVPYGGIVLDGAGSIYWTSSSPGEACVYGCGAVFQLNLATGKTTTLYNFTGLADGAYPAAGLALDSEGNLYGTTQYGGTTTTPGGGYGVVFKIDTTGKETVLHTFDGTDGAQPQANLLLDSAGNLYGTTAYGGSTACRGGCGVVFKIAPQ
ncbi:MAG: choice-of-anchor tandem repeat GloVer-containing protein, partial [Thermoplasmata archaeon]